MQGDFAVVRGDGFEVNLLREELAGEAVHTFVGAAFPGALSWPGEGIGARVDIGLKIGQTFGDGQCSETLGQLVAAAQGEELFNQGGRQ